MAVQRHRLLRLLAGWFVLVSLLRTFPLCPQWTRCFCRYIASLLSCAEAALDCLTIVQARLLATEDGIVFEVAPRRCEPPCANAEVPTLAVLCRRIVVLQTRVRNLRRGAKRLLRRAASRSAHGSKQRDCACPVPSVVAACCSANGAWANEVLLALSAGGFGRAPPQPTVAVRVL